MRRARRPNANGGKHNKPIGNVPAGARFSGWNLDKLRGVDKPRGRGAARAGSRKSGGPTDDASHKHPRSDINRGLVLAPPPSLSLSGSTPARAHKLAARVRIIDAIAMSADNQELISTLLKRLMQGMDESAQLAAQAEEGPDAEHEPVSSGFTSRLTQTQVAPLSSSHNPAHPAVPEPTSSSSAVKLEPAGPSSTKPSAASDTEATEPDQLVGSFAVFHYLTKNLAFSELWAKKVCILLDAS